MGKFQDAMNDFGQSVDLPDEFVSAINDAYSSDFSSYEAKVSGLEGQLAEKDQVINKLNTDHNDEISSLKSANYDLLRAVPRDAKSSSSDGKEDSNSDHDTDDISIDDLFTVRKK